MAGQHLRSIVAAVATGDNDKIVDAVLAAALDGALVVVTHKMGAPPEEPAGAAGRARDPFAGRVRPVELTSPEGGGRPSTAVGVGGGERPPGPPPGQEPAPAEGTPEATHEAWTARVTKEGLAPRLGPGAPAGPPVAKGTYETVAGERSFANPEAAFRAYDEALTRAGGREVGVYRNTASSTGEYVVRVGNEQSVNAPQGEGRWESVLHKHPNPENVLTRRMPAPQDVQNTLHAAFRAGRQVTEFIDYPMPDGRHGMVAYTVEPMKGQVTIKYETTDGATVERTFASIEEYASHYSQRTTYVDPASPEYQWMIRDLHEFYGGGSGGGGATARGTLKPGVPEAPESSTAARTGAKPKSTEPAVPSRAQLERAAQRLEHDLEPIESHPDAPEMAQELTTIRRLAQTGREADAATRLVALQRRIARAQLYAEHGSVERTYGESEEVMGRRVIEYVPETVGRAVRLDASAPTPSDATGQRLLAHIRRAIARYESEGLTDAQARAVRAAPQPNRAALQAAYRGARIDEFAKQTVMDDPELEHVYVTVLRERGPDFFDSRTGTWYDITTTGAWKQHVADYGPSQPGKTTIPGFRLPTETHQ